MPRLNWFWLCALILPSVFTYGNERFDSSVDNSVEEPFYLSKGWEFYWNQLLDPEDLENSKLTPVPIKMGSWHRHGNYSVLGFATYRLVTQLPSNRKNLSLYFPVINCAAKIWLNGELVEEVGKVSSSVDTYKAVLTGVVISVPDNLETLDIVVQVSNFSYFSGGIGRTPSIENASTLYERINRNNGVEDFFAGSLIAMFIYQLILYFLYHRGKPYLWLGLICLAVALRALVTHGGSFLLPHLFPMVDWEIWKKIEFGSVYVVVALFPLYVYDLFKKFSPRNPIIFFVSVAALLCTAVVITPQYMYGRLLDICHVSLLLAFVYAVYSISKAWKSGNEDAKVILLGVLASFPFILTEILKNSLLYPLNIQFMYLVELGVLVFLLFQVYLLANHYAKSYRNLETLNLNLEKMVEERTGELTTANKVKDRLLSVMSHDIKSPLNSLRGILQIYSMGAMTQQEFTQFSQQVENDLAKTSMLVENILYWTASQLKGVQLKIEEFDLKALIEENVQLFQTIAKGKQVSLRHNIMSKLSIKADRNIINLVLRNLISNAIKFSYEQGEIDIVVTLKTDYVLIQVKDQGVGMSEETLHSLLSTEFTMSQKGTGNEKGTGLGLALCREYLEKAGGSLHVESVEGKGSRFNILLPTK